MPSLIPRPKPPCGEEGLVTFECFLGYAQHYLFRRMVLHNPLWTGIANVLIGLHENETADSAQPRKCSIVTCTPDPFLMRGWGLGARL